jgi:hypothetical protein
VIAQHTPAPGGGNALDAFIDAAAGILAADSTRWGGSPTTFRR